MKPLSPFQYNQLNPKARIGAAFSGLGGFSGGVEVREGNVALTVVPNSRHKALVADTLMMPSVGTGITQGRATLPLSRDHISPFPFVGGPGSLRGFLNGLGLMKSDVDEASMNTGAGTGGSAGGKNTTGTAASSGAASNPFTDPAVTMALMTGGASLIGKAVTDDQKAAAERAQREAAQRYAEAMAVQKAAAEAAAREASLGKKVSASRESRDATIKSAAAQDVLTSMPPRPPTSFPGGSIPGVKTTSGSSYSSGGGAGGSYDEALPPELVNDALVAAKVTGSTNWIPLAIGGVVLAGVAWWALK